MSVIDQITPVANMSDYSSNYLPTASSTGMGIFKDIAKVVTRVGGEIGGVSLEVPSSFAELLSAQMQAQEEMQTVSMVSNIERSKHETNMVAIRNIKVG